MKIIDEGIFLFSKNYGEKSKILYVLSKENGLIKGLSKSRKNSKNNLIVFDKITFSWSSKDPNGLGFLNFEQQKANPLDDYIFSIIKASVSELCLRFLPPWEKNTKIFKDVTNLSLLDLKSNSYLIGKYINWEISFLKNLGYGLDINVCSVSGKKNDTYFISPKTGNAVCYIIGKKYSKKLFKIPECMKDEFRKDHYNDYKDALKITEHFFLKILEKKSYSFIFRNQIINQVHYL